MRSTVVLALAVLTLPACADEAPPASGDAIVYRVDAFVLEDASHGPELCLGGVAESYPPQCDGIPLEGWDWGAVEDEDVAQGARWGQFDVRGTYDGTTFTVLEAGPAVDEGPRADPVEWTRCPEPEGGWVVVDASTADDAAVQAASRAAEAEEDFAGVWVDTVDEGPDAGATILNAAFTGDLDRHEAELREVWGGPLCLQEHERTFADLRRFQRELGTEEVVAELGLETTWSDIDVVDNTVVLGVVVARPEAEAALAERYGEGTVELFPALVPVG